jgi:glutathione S-transferase
MTMKLTYFNVCGKGELTRMIFAAGDIKFTDTRIEMGDWAAVKPTTPFGFLPTLEVDGQVYSQGLSIARFAATRASLRGKTEMEILFVDQLVETIATDVLASNVMPCSMYKLYMPDAGKLAPLVVKVRENVPALLAALEKQVKGKDTFLAGGFSYADISILVMANTMQALEFGDLLTGKYPKLNAIIASTKKNAKIAKYVSTRPKTLDG